MQQVRYRRTKETDKVIVLEARDVCAHLIFISYIVNVSLHSVYTVIMCIANAITVLYITLLYRKRNSTRSGIEFSTLYFDLDLVLATMIQSLSLSYILFSMSLSSSSSFSGVAALIIRLFSAFPFDASASAFSTSSRISFVLRTNLPLTTIRFPFLHYLYTRNSSLNSVFSFRKRVFSKVVLSKATPNYSIYYFIGVSRVEEQTIELTSDIASYSSIPSSSELFSRERSRSFRVIIGSGVT
jgi:hypothetical protein